MSGTGNSLREAEGYMRLALRLAGKGSPSPNPYVGAVIVRDGKIIAKGFHRKAGLDHAEVAALKSLANPQDARGATMYVNLEPCNHYGRTPPCANAIIAAGISRVVFSMKDPNPNVTGGGEEELKKHGIEVERGVLAEDAAQLNEVFVKYAKTKNPFVVLKAAMSMDGKIATRTGDSKWITGEKARRYAHKLRGKYDAIAVGINTVLRDDPQLTARIRGGRDPLRVVLDDRLWIPANAKVLADSNAVVATCEDCDPVRRRELEQKGLRILLCGRNRVDLRLLLAKLGEMGKTSLMVEGGSEVHGSFVDAGLADKFVLFYAPKIIGGQGAKPAIGGLGCEKVAEAIALNVAGMRKIGPDFLIEAYPEKR
ncbi:2,5-diamino-6-ribosylamino-4(3H)-pyrimidinone 5'-phosphate reductase [uncultured archaeon]|nr:2,5-diamino-6-ribosylamino-4(3H)-pyrimidinone 5'-phosphate reductase [uncultured archaeon]